MRKGERGERFSRLQSKLGLVIFPTGSRNTSRAFDVRQLYRFRRSRRFFSASSQLRTCRRNASSTYGGPSGAVPKSGFSLLTSSISRFRFSIRVWMSSLMRTQMHETVRCGSIEIARDPRCLHSKFAKSRIFNTGFPRLFPGASLPTEEPEHRS